MHGHEVMVETGAGAGIGFDDEAYRAAGASIVATAEEVFALAEMIVKVKEPQPAEYRLLREDQILFTYLHLAADRPQTEALMQSGCVAIAYETVTDRARPAAAAGADERGRRPHERPGRRPSAWRRCRAAPACCSAACPACTPPRSWSSAAASPAPTPSAWRWAWRRRST